MHQTKRLGLKMHCESPGIVNVRFAGDPGCSAAGQLMELGKYFAIGHERHLFCNPLSEAKVDELVALLALSDEARVLDIACGKAEFLVRTVRR